MLKCNENAANRYSYIGEVYSIGENKRKKDILHGLNKEWRELHDKGYIHIHDLDAYGLTYNCLTFNLLQDFPYDKFDGYSQERKVIGYYDYLKNLFTDIGNEQSGGMALANYDDDSADIFERLHVDVFANEAIIRACTADLIEWCSNTHTRMGQTSYYVTLNIGLADTEAAREIARILREYGEEPYAWQIAGKIVQQREQTPITTTLQLADLVAAAVPPKERRKSKNPARRTFQAVRIAVNGELDALNEGLEAIFARLAPGGRLCVITFHSLEDRLVKNKFRRWAQKCTCPPEQPICTCGGVAKATLITRHPIEADAEELEENRRSRSAKLRVLEKN